VRKERVCHGLVVREINGGNELKKGKSFVHSENEWRNKREEMNGEID